MEEIKPITLVDEAKAVRDELLKLKEELVIIKNDIDKAKAEQILGGKSEAGIMQQPVDEEQAKRDRINKMLETTGMKI
jgi:hypothetical protein